MASDPQGTISWPGINPAGILHGSIGLGHGTTPSVCVLYIAPQSMVAIADTGTLTFRYGSFSRAWKNCRVDFISSDISNDGRKVWQVSIMTRPWKWKVGPGRISGFYNHKVGPNSDEFIVGRERDPRELVEACLKAMGETVWSGITNIPLKPQIETEWDCETNPANLLNELLERFACRVCMDKQDRIKIVQLGKGKSLPSGGTELTRGEVLNPPDRPDRIEVVTAHTLIQADLSLVAVGLDTDGEIKPIDKLSYKPSGGWSKIDPYRFNNVPDANHKDFAKATVFRWYQIETPFDFKLSSAGQAITINTLQQILPLGDKQIDKTPSKGPQVNRQSLPPWVYGIYYQGRERDRNNTNKMRPGVQNKNKASGFYDGSFEIDRERGIVKFAEPVYQVIPATQAQPQQPRAAKLRLRIAFPYRFGKAAEFHRHERGRNTKGKKQGTQARVEKREEIGLTCIQEYNDNFQIVAVKANLVEVNKYADHHLDAIEREYQTLTPETKSYAGFLDVELDGKIRQIVYKIDERGAATTDVASDNEELPRVPPYRFLREVDAAGIALQPKQLPSKKADVTYRGSVRPEQGGSLTANLSSGQGSILTQGGGFGITNTSGGP